MTKISIAFVWALVVVCVMPTLTSCSDEEEQVVKEEWVVNLSPELQEKIDFGCISYSDLFTDEKIETEANAEYRKYIMSRNSNEFGINKTYRFNSDDEEDYSSFVGVIKDQTCSGYRELKIYLDNEDHRNINQHKGWMPGSITDNHNLSFTVCIVPAVLFHSIGKDYAVIKLGRYMDKNFEYFPNGEFKASFLGLHLDAESNSPVTSISMSYVEDFGKGQEQKWFNTAETNDRLNPGVYVDSSKDLNMLLLCFYKENATRYDSNNNLMSRGLPNLGFTYGVFGRIWEGYDNGEKYMGWYRSDDEDNGNGNYACLFDCKTTVVYDTKILCAPLFTQMYTVKDIKSNPSFYEDKNYMNVPFENRFQDNYKRFRGFIELGGNTVFHFSKNEML